MRVVFERKTGRVLFPPLAKTRRGRPREDRTSGGYATTTLRSSRITPRISSLRILSMISLDLDAYLCKQRRGYPTGETINSSNSHEKCQLRSCEETYRLA